MDVSSTSQKSPLSDRLAHLFHITLSEPSLNDNRSPEKRLREEVSKRLRVPHVAMPLPVVKALGALVLKGQLSLDCICLDGAFGPKVVGVGPHGHVPSPLGIAIDLGSTSIVLYLLDLVSGKEVSQRTYENPQRRRGEDILSRILFARTDNGKGLTVLRQEVVEVLNKGISELVSSQARSPEDVYMVSIAGNTTMIHFLLGLDPSNICKEPYCPVCNSLDILSPGELGLSMNPLGAVYCFPNVGSYFGGDLLAGILASGMHRRDEISMLIDVGTNAEVVLGNSSWMVACAGAAGPALEGGILTCGMRAMDGAIERVSIDPKDLSVEYRVIGGGRPTGICGSGIIDLLAEMFVAGLVDPTGKLVTERDKRRMTTVGGEYAYVVADAQDTAHGKPVYITQSDIKNLIRSKGAMYTILNVVIQSVGIGFEAIDRFYVAGAFGNYIDPEKAVIIGMLPDVPLERFVGLGNAAGLGAKEVLLRKGACEEVEDITKKITYLEMNVRGEFMNQLTGALFLPHTDRSRFPSVWKRLERHGTGEAG